MVRGPRSKGPLNISLGLVAGGFLNYGIKVGDVVARYRDLIVIGNGKLRVSLGNARVYLPRSVTSFKMIRPEQLVENLRIAKTFVELHGHLQGLGGLLELIEGTSLKDQRHRANRFSAYALPKVRRLTKAIGEGDIRAIREAPVK